VPIEGYFRQVSETSIRGWCWDTARPDETLDVRIQVGDRVIACTKANLLRQDLLTSGIGNGHYGFRCDLPVELREDEKLGLRVHAVSSEGQSALRRLKSPIEAPAFQRARRLSRRIPRCILHIGTEKTGTTSLQAFLAINQGRLLAHGVLVPRTIASHADQRVLNHVELVTYASDVNKFNGSRLANQISVAPEQLREHRAAIEAKIAQEIEEAGPACHLLILSCEFCHSRLFLADEVERLRDFLLSLAETIDIVVYLRPQHEMAVSLFTTTLRNGSVKPSILPDLKAKSAARTKRIDAYYNYDKLVILWESVFGAEAVTARIYDREIISSFVAQLPPGPTGTLDPAGFINPRSRHNTRLPASAQRVLLAVNRYLAKSGAADDSRLRDRLFKVLSEGETGDAGLLPARQAVEIFQAHFEESNERLRARRFPDRQSLFRLDFSAYPESPTPSDATAEEIAETLAKLLRGSTVSL
jgi:muconolactone delta-isomerase